MIHPSRAHSRKRRSLTVLLTGGLAASAALVATSAPVSAEPTIPLQLLAFNDYHGHVEDSTPGQVGDEDAGGAEFLAAKLTELRGEATGTSLTVAAGDLIGGSPAFSGLFHDEPSIETLNEMGLDVAGVGNHEFDEGVTELMRMQNGGCHPDDGCYFTDYDPDTAGDQEFAGAAFPYLAANVIDDATGNPILGDGNGDGDLDGYELVDVGGQQVAFIGMTLQGTPELVAASGITGVSFEDEVDTANALVPEIKAEGAEAIIVLLHEGGIPNPVELNGCSGLTGPIIAINDGLDPEIDAIVSGHTHQPYTCSLPDPDGDPRPVTSAWSNGRVVTEINMLLDDVTGEVDRSSVTAVNHGVIQSELTADAAQTAIIARWQPLFDATAREAVGTISEDILRGGNPPGDDRGVESAAVNLVADAQLAATTGTGAQLALMNPGGVRSDLLFAEADGEGDGVVTFGEAFTFQPFNNQLIVVPMTGAQIVSVLEEQCQPAGTSRPVLFLGVSEGFTYDLAIETQAGVCTGVSVSNVQLNGVDLDPAAMYQVTVNSFLADGGDNFDTLGTLDPADRTIVGPDLDALIDYLDANPGLSAPPTDRVDATFTTLPPPVNSLSPARILETRTGDDDATVDGEFEGGGRVPDGGTVELQVAGRGGVAEDADAALLNIGAVLPSANGFLTVWPCGEERPLASNVNYLTNDLVSNAVLADIGDEGKVCIYTKVETDIIVDVNGEVPAGGTPVPVVPARFLDTRSGPDDKTFDGQFEGIGRAGAGSTTEVVVTDRYGVPADAEAVMLNVGAVVPDAAGFLTVWPCGEDQPLASNVNYFPSDLVSNGVLAKVGEDGKVCIYTLEATDLYVDVNGYVPAGGTPTALTPARLLETRSGDDDATVDGEFEGLGRADAGSTIELTVAGRGGVGEDAKTVVLNVGSVLASAPGFLTVWPCGEDQPLASNVNYLGNDIVSNAVVAKVGVDGKVCIYTKTETDIIADVNATSSEPVAVRPAAE